MPDNPVLPIAEDWNDTIHSLPSNPLTPGARSRNVWGDTPASPFSVFLGQAAAAGGSVKVRLNSDFGTVRTIKLVPHSPV